MVVACGVFLTIRFCVSYLACCLLFVLRFSFGMLLVVCRLLFVVELWLVVC